MRVYDPSTKAMDYFQLYYSDTVLSDLVQFADGNAEQKRRTKPDENKRERTTLTLEGIQSV